MEIAKWMIKPNMRKIPPKSETIKLDCRRSQQQQKKKKRKKKVKHTMLKERFYFFYQTILNDERISGKSHLSSHKQKLQVE